MTVPRTINGNLSAMFLFSAMYHGVLVNMGFTDEKGQPRPCYIMGIRRESGYNSQMYGALFDVMFEDGKTTTSYFHLE